MSNVETDTGAIKLSCFLTRRSDLTREEVLRYWTNNHTALLARPVEGAPAVRKYVQLYTTADMMPGFLPPTCDGVAEIWMDSVADAISMFTSEYYNSVIAKDEANFLDRSKSVMMFSHERTIA